mgnify:CR=1 FL=1
MASPSFDVARQSYKPLDVGALFEYWHPDRDGVEQASASVAAHIFAIHPGLRLVRPPAGAPMPTHPWLVWMQKATIRHRLCPGWKLLFAWETSGDDGQAPRPLPIDNRLFATIYLRDRRHFPNAVNYFDDIVTDIKRRKAAREAKDRNERHDIAADLQAHKKIKNIGPGNRFALHHDGTLIPGRGEQNWLLERQQHSLPSDVLRRIRDEKRGGR